MLGHEAALVTAVAMLLLLLQLLSGKGDACTGGAEDSLLGLPVNFLMKERANLREQDDKMVFFVVNGSSFLAPSILN